MSALVAAGSTSATGRAPGSGSQRSTDCREKSGMTTTANINSTLQARQGKCALPLLLTQEGGEGWGKEAPLSNSLPALRCGEREPRKPCGISGILGLPSSC